MRRKLGLSRTDIYPWLCEIDHRRGQVYATGLSELEEEVHRRLEYMVDIPLLLSLLLDKYG